MVFFPLIVIVCGEKNNEKGMNPLLLSSECLPAALADTRGGHGVAIYPTLAVGCDVYGAALLPVRVLSSNNVTHTDFLKASTAFLVWQYFYLPGHVPLWARDLAKATHDYIESIERASHKHRDFSNAYKH